MNYFSSKYDFAVYFLIIFQNPTQFFLNISLTMKSFLYKSLASLSISILAFWNCFSIETVFFDRIPFSDFIKSAIYQKIPFWLRNNSRKVKWKLIKKLELCIGMIGKLKFSIFRIYTIRHYFLLFHHNFFKANGKIIRKWESVRSNPSWWWIFSIFFKRPCLLKYSVHLII